VIRRRRAKTIAQAGRLSGAFVKNISAAAVMNVIFEGL